MKRIADLYKMDKYQILREVLGVKKMAIIQKNTLTN